jgi:hypothetical protein
MAEERHWSGWQTVGLAVMGVFAGLGGTDWFAVAEYPNNHIPIWPAYVAFVIAAFGLIGAIVPLVRGHSAKQEVALDRPASVSPAVTPLVPTANTTKTLPAPADTKGRVFVEPGVTLDYLWNIQKDRLAVQAKALTDPFVGKWMRLSGPVYNVNAWHELGSDSFCTVALEPPGTTTRIVWLTFGSRDTCDRLAVLKQGDRIAFIGELADIRQASIELKNCELESVE